MTGTEAITSGPVEGADELRHHYTQLSGVRLHHVEAGPADGTPVVLLHGWPQTWYAWRRIVPALAATGLRVLAVEYRGAGESSRPLAGYDKATMAGDVRELLDALGVERPHVVGRDIGVMVAYALAAQRPERVASLAMVDVPVPGTAAWRRAAADPQTWHFGLHRQRDLAERLVAGREYDYLSTFYRARLRVADAVTEADLGVYARAYAAPGAMRAGFELYRAFDEDERVLGELARTPLPMPVLAIGGEDDTGPLVADAAREVAGDVRVVLAPDSGHWTPEESPGLLCRVLVEFWRDVARR